MNRLTVDRQIVREFEALLLERRAKLRRSVRTRIAERRTGEPRRSPEDATNAVESLGEELEVAMLDRESREAAQIDAALERLARDEYGICRSWSSGSGGSRRCHSPSAAPRVKQESRRASAESAPNGGPAPSVPNPEHPGRPSRPAEKGCGGRLDVCGDPGAHQIVVHASSANSRPSGTVRRTTNAHFVKDALRPGHLAPFRSATATSTADHGRVLL